MNESERVFHKLHGYGEIIKKTADKIYVSFDGKQLIFDFPGAFEKGYLSAVDDEIKKCFQNDAASEGSISVRDTMLDAASYTEGNCEITESILRKEIEAFAQKRDWTVKDGQNGSIGSYWIKDGNDRMVSIEPKSYGWLIGIRNNLFSDVDDPATCMLMQPAGEHRFDKHKITKNFWIVTNPIDLLSFLHQ